MKKCMAKHTARLGWHIEWAEMGGISWMPDEATANALEHAADVIDAAKNLLCWFKAVEGALTAGELLHAGCPNQLHANVEQLRDAVRASVTLKGIGST